MNVRDLGFPAGQTPFEDEVPFPIHTTTIFNHLNKVSCGTGDNFANKGAEIDCDLVDMEAYALAKVCYFEKVPFTAVKYVSDNANEAAAKDWIEHVADAGKLFLELYEQTTV